MIFLLYAVDARSGHCLAYGAQSLPASHFRYFSDNFVRVLM